MSLGNILHYFQAIPRQTTNPSTKETFEKFRARVKISDNKFVWLGSFEESSGQALSEYTFDEQSYIDPMTDTVVVYRKKNLISVRTMIELMTKVGGVQWEHKTQREIGDSNDANLNTDSPPFKWMMALLEGDDGMVDIFRYFYPSAENR